MLFNSPQFAVFFVIVTTLFFALPHRFRWGMLLAASCVFYMAFVPKYILILFFLILVDYAAGLGIEASQGARRKTILVASLAANLGILGFFKYFNFANENLAWVAHQLHWNYPIANLAIVLPIGLSFHTFQSMSYTIEVYYGNQKAERHLGIYALYVLFYPQLVAGPIERPQNILHQFYEEKHFDYARVRDGLLLMLGGLLKKTLIADRVATIVSPIYGNPTAHEGWPLILATYLFGVQVYCDFSGYSDIARGAAQVMGYNLVENFNRPYSARNIADFWRRWHMSLLSWFRSYIYTPIAFSGERATYKVYLAIFLVFLASGIWHGANWTFVLWGVLHATYSIASVLSSKWRARLGSRLGLERIPRLHACWQVFITFNMVSFSWVFFRAASVSDSWHIATHLFSGLGRFPLDVKELGLIAALVIGLELLQHIQGIRPLRARIAERPRWQRWAIYYAAIIFMMQLGSLDPKEFIYFQF